MGGWRGILRTEIHCIEVISYCYKVCKSFVSGSQEWIKEHFIAERQPAMKQGADYRSSLFIPVSRVSVKPVYKTPTVYATIENK